MKRGIFDRLLGRRAAASSTTVTNVNIMWGGGFHTLPGMKPEQKTFEVSIPFDNSSAIENLPENTFKFSDTTVTIRDITVDKPFELVAVDPKMPLTVKTNERVSLRLTVRAPDTGYSGPMTVRFLQDDAGIIKLEINKVVLVAKGRRVEIENSGIIMSVRKGHIFKNSVQLYKALSYGDEVTGISLSAPFRLASTSPPVPFRLDDPNSFIAGLFIQAPDTSYAGPLEITLNIS